MGQNSRNSIENRLRRIEQNTKRISKQLEGETKSTTARFYQSIGFSALAVAVSMWAVSITSEHKEYSYVAFAIFILALVIMFVSAWQYARQINRILGFTGLSFIFVGTALVMILSRINVQPEITIILLYIGLILIIIGIPLIVLAPRFRKKKGRR